MTREELREIRERDLSWHSTESADCNCDDDSGTCNFCLDHGRDVSTLLAEVERLQERVAYLETFAVDHSTTAFQTGLTIGAVIPTSNTETGR